MKIKTAPEMDAVEEQQQFVRTPDQCYWFSGNRMPIRPCSTLGTSGSDCSRHGQKANAE
ncbi:putative phage protein [Pectobacterium atrosepticum SCRI1043]|uniref:Phage protein n=2 Tax=Pectobacterium atrosepticum TaxID=29471 RepID=Q6D9T6_PECAS|nr:hypothetical protein KCQ_12896 [Pectobacterium atrosepticum]CAG73442.1 putative phage protein [Pectobacterium atrosepticum SCRI1043]